MNKNTEYKSANEQILFPLNKSNAPFGLSSLYKGILPTKMPAIWILNKYKLQ